MTALLVFKEMRSELNSFTEISDEFVVAVQEQIVVAKRDSPFSECDYIVAVPLAMLRFYINCSQATRMFPASTSTASRAEAHAGSTESPATLAHYCHETRPGDSKPMLACAQYPLRTWLAEVV
jgi:hypothetical protein